MSRGYDPNQPWIPGLEPGPIDTVFFAIRPDVSAIGATDKIAQHLRNSCGLEGQPLGQERFHTSLHGIGCYEGLRKDLVEKARDVASTIAVSSFDIAFDRAASFDMRGRKRPLVLLSGESQDALMTFQEVLGEALARSGLRYTPRSRFTPHMTLLYDYRSVSMRSVEPVRWTAREFILIHSPQGRGRHVHIEGWELKPENSRIH